jgi:hypothetical protein
LQIRCGFPRRGFESLLWLYFSDMKSELLSTTDGTAPAHIYPEAACETVSDVPIIGQDLIISGVYNGNGVKAVIMQGGAVLWRRGKHRLTSRESGFHKGPPPELYNGLLVLICYELLFPEDYYHLQPTHVVHLVGFPMYSEHQYKAWYGLQKAACRHFRCPLVSVSGSPEDPLALEHMIG